MRNITVCIPDEIYLQARICAARSGLSVSALVRRFFESLLELPAPSAATAFSILLFSETWKPSGFFLKKKPPCTGPQCQYVNRKCSKRVRKLNKPTPPLLR
jgi:hypothetical protein